MNHVLRKTGEVYRYGNGHVIPVYTPDGWYEYAVHEGDTVVINDGPTSSMYILRGAKNCEECPISIDNKQCAVAVKCKLTGIYRAVCRIEFGVHAISEVLEDL